MDVKVHEEESPAENVLKLTLAIKESKKMIAKMKFDYEV